MEVAYQHLVTVVAVGVAAADVVAADVAAADVAAVSALLLLLHMEDVLLRQGKNVT